MRYSPLRPEYLISRAPGIQNTAVQRAEKNEEQKKARGRIETKSHGRGDRRWRKSGASPIAALNFRGVDGRVENTGRTARRNVRQESGLDRSILPWAGPGPAQGWGTLFSLQKYKTARREGRRIRVSGARNATTSRRRTGRTSSLQWLARSRRMPGRSKRASKATKPCPDPRRPHRSDPPREVFPEFRDDSTKPSPVPASCGTPVL